MEREQRASRPRARLRRAASLAVLMAGVAVTTFGGTQIAGASTSKSIGTTRAKAEAVLAIDEPGIKWKASVLANKEPRVMGKSRNGLDLFELDGRPAALTDETLSLGMVSGNTAAAAESLSMLVGVEYGHEVAGIWIGKEYNAMSAGGKFHPIDATKVFHLIKFTFTTTRISGGAIIALLNVAHS